MRWAHFQRDCNARTGKHSDAYTRAKHRKLVSQVLKNPKYDAISGIQESARTFPGTMVGTATNGTMAGVCDESNDDLSSVGWHEGWEQTYDSSTRSVSLGCLDVSATSGPKRFQWSKMNLGTGAQSIHSH